MKFKLILSLLLLTIINLCQGQTNLFGNLQFGSYEVGLRQFNFVSQVWPDTVELNIHLWYPAKSSSKESLTFADYFQSEAAFNNSELHQDLAVKIGGAPDILPSDSLDLIINASMKAVKNAKAAKGKFPLLIWSSRRETVVYQCIISEYLASHGYSVAFAERIPSAPFPWELKTKDEKKEALNHHLKNIEASIKFLNRRKNTDNTKTGIISWSYAGESAILSQINNAAIDGVVGLSSIGFSNGVYLGEDLAQQIDATKIKVPYLMLSEKIGTNGKERMAPDIFDAMHPASRFVSFKELAHGNFNAIEGMIPGIIRTRKVQSWSKGGEVAQLGYETICKLTLSFLDSIFKSNTFEESTLSLLEALPESFIAIQQPK